MVILMVILTVYFNGYLYVPEMVPPRARRPPMKAHTMLGKSFIMAVRGRKREGMISSLICAASFSRFIIVICFNKLGSWALVRISSK